jgi:hypothetical protein
MVVKHKSVDTYLQPVLELWGEGQEQSRCKITGNCMAPLIQDGDVLGIRHGNSDIHTGDVVVYGEPGNFYVHRVIKVHMNNGDRTYMLKPDNYFTVRQSIQVDKIIGKVEEVSGSSGHLYFGSWFWRCVNPLLGFTFYSCWRSAGRDTLYWRSVNNTIQLWRKFKPERFLTFRTLLGVMSRVHTILSSVGPGTSDEK